MGEFTNDKKSNFIGLAALIIMSLAAGLLIYFQFN